MTDRHTADAAHPQEQVAYIECIEAQEALYWEARRRGWPLDDKSVGDILRLVAPILATPREPDAATAPAFDRATDDYGHRPRWTADEVEKHRALEEKFREWAEDKRGSILWDADQRLAEAIAGALDITLVQEDE